MRSKLGHCPSKEKLCHERKPTLLQHSGLADFGILSQGRHKGVQKVKPTLQQSINQSISQSINSIK
jgi:hypothetical protein